MTDPRIDDRLLAAIRKLPRGSGVVFRHYGLEGGARRLLFRQVRHICAQRGHCLLLAGDERTALRWFADGIHALNDHRLRSSVLMRTAPVHSVSEIRRAQRHQADALFLSPVNATRSHPGEACLGSYQFARLARLCNDPVIALGGMTRARAQSWPRHIACSWAAIDAFNP